MTSVNTGSVHHTKEHVLTELHLGCAVLACILTCCFACFFRNVLRRICLLGFGLQGGQIIGFNFVAEVDTVESVKSLSIDFTASLDVKGNFEAFAFLHLGHVPEDVKAAFAFFRGHGDIVSLTVGTLHFPFFDFKLGWKDVVDVQVAQSGVAVVLEENQDFVAALSSKRNGLLSCAEVSAVVNDLHAGRFGWFPGADWTKALSTELNPGGSVNTLVAR